MTEPPADRPERKDVQSAFYGRTEAAGVLGGAHATRGEARPRRGATPIALSPPPPPLAATSRTSASLLLSSSYKDLGSPPQVGARFLRFLLHNDRTLAALRKMAIPGLTASVEDAGGERPIPASEDDGELGGGPGRGRNDDDVSLEINAYDLIAHDAELGHMLLRFPSTLLTLLEDAAAEARLTLAERIYSALESELGPGAEEGPTSGDARGKGGGGGGEEKKIPVPILSRSDEEIFAAKDSASTAPALLLLERMRQVRSSSGGSYPSFAGRLHARLVHLPPHVDYCKSNVSRLLSSDVGRVVQLTGIVTKVSPIRMIECARSYRCGAAGTGSKGGGGCGLRFAVHADFSRGNNALPRPAICPSPYGGRCDGTRFEALAGESSHTDYQEIAVRGGTATTTSSRNDRAGGSLPRSVLIKLTHDLVDSCRPGDDVVVVGSLLAHWADPPERPGRTCDAVVAVRAHSVRPVNTEEGSTWGGDGDAGGSGEGYRAEFNEYWSRPDSIDRPIAARDFIVGSVCPRLYGMLAIKLSLLMALIGGTSEVDEDDPSLARGDREPQQEPDLSDEDDDEPEQFTVHTDGEIATDCRRSCHSSSGRRPGRGRSRGGRGRRGKGGGDAVRTRRRAQSHILLVGDPGTGKSQFLRFAAALSPRSVLTTGTGCSSAGLTCAAVKEPNGEFALEAGALVLADRGVCCIDEFGCVKEEDRAAIHEAMEQQTISVAKAGIVCKLNSRASVVAVMNPRGGLYDTKLSVERNTGVSAPLLSRFDLIFVMLDSSNWERDDRIASFLLNRAILPTYGFSTTGVVVATADPGNNSEGTRPHWSMDKLRAYIAHIREAFRPTLSSEASDLLERHYARCRSRPSSLNVTVRFLESLIRLCQAHARLMYRRVATLQDAVAVVLLMECSAATSGGLYASSFDDPQDHLFREPMHTDFPPPDRADVDFSLCERTVLERYGMLGIRGGRSPSTSDAKSGDNGGTGCDTGAGRRGRDRCPERDRSPYPRRGSGVPTGTSPPPRPSGASWMPQEEEGGGRGGGHPGSVSDNIDCWGRTRSSQYPASSQYSQLSPLPPRVDPFPGPRDRSYGPAGGFENNDDAAAAALERHASSSRQHLSERQYDDARPRKRRRSQRNAD